MGPVELKEMSERLAAIRALFTAALVTRVVKESLVHYDEHTDAEIEAGVLMVTSLGEGDYSNSVGLIAMNGVQNLMLIGHIRLVESATPKAIEDAELAFIKEVKDVLKTGLPGLSFALKRVEHSAQLDHPYGWFVASVDAGPPIETT